MYHFELKPFRRNWAPSFQFNDFDQDEYFAPTCEVIDEEKFLTISLDVPGVNKEDLDIEVKENHLSITGERKTRTNENNQILRSEKRYGKFSRTFTLPPNLNADKIEARFENGVLEIVLPKEEKTMAKKIQINDWKKELKN